MSHSLQVTFTHAAMMNKNFPAKTGLNQNHLLYTTGQAAGLNLKPGIEKVKSKSKQITYTKKGPV